uniref:Myosin XIX n=1 Tax=Sinocyclocheilus grahami TaxID=75366 RepID=A0A672RGK8_SINGR
MQVHGLKDRTQDLRKSLNDSLEGDIRDFLINEAELHTYDDLTKVNPVTPSTVLKCLQARYSAKVFYTHAGCTLVALNPFQPIPHLYSLDVMREYHSAPQPQVNTLKPTWTSRCLMKYYATVATSSQKCQDTVEKIERRVLDSNPVMEAFGNACTLRNSNSSRFGKYIQLQLNGSQLLVGASVQTYLLEKTRVAFQAPNERNFHIFYQMMKGATEKQRLDWMLPLEQDFAWLPHAEKTLEEDCLQETVEAMINLGIDEGKRTQIFRILAGLLQLGNVDFSPASEEAQPCFLQKTADLLQVPLDELQSCLTVRTLRAGKQSVLKPCTQSECGVRRDCLAKVIYAQLFDWLVTFINNSMCADNPTWCNFIGLLDVYGFECFLLNNLEQLCINYANEKLQQHFVAHYLKAQQEEYVTEGLQWSFIRYQDNQCCLDLIEGSPSSIFSLLNEECRLNRASDAKQFRVRLQKELSDNASISWDKLSKEPHFTVAHYADKVSYQIEGMMEKNKDPVPPEIISLLQKSQDSLLHSLFADGDRESEGSRGHSKVVTVVSKFKVQIFKNWYSVFNSMCIFFTGVRSWLVRREIKKWHKAASVIQNKWRRWRAWMDALAEAELDDAEDFMENEASSVLPKLLKERGSVQLSSIQEPVMVRGWPIGLAMASAPSITVSLTATGFQRIMSMMACLKIPFRHGEYKVKTNQFDQGVASIRAQPRVRDAANIPFTHFLE